MGYGQLKTVHKVINYEPKDYEAHNQNWQTVQDEKGVMFFANGDGILEYDGTNWFLHKTQTETNVLSVAIGYDGIIFYGGVGEIGYLEVNEKGRYETVEIIDNDSENVIGSEFFWDIHVYENKVIFRSDNTMVLFENGESTLIDISSQGFRSSVIVNGELWVQSNDNTVFYVNLDTFSSKDDFNVFTELENKTNFIIQNVLDYSEDQYLLVTNANGLFLLDKNSFNLVKFDSPINSLSDLSINNALLLPNNEIALSTTNYGVYILSKYGTIKMQYSDQNGLKTNAIREIFYDREGLLWFNSDVGLSKALFNKPFSWLPDGFSSIKGNANAIIECNNELYVASNEGVYRIGLDGSSIRTDKLNQTSVQAFDVDEINGQIFAATTDGLFVLEKDDLKSITNRYTRSIVALSNTYAAVGGRKALLLLKKIDDEWIVVNEIPVLDEFLHFEKDPQNNNVIWGGLYSSGVTRLEIDSINHIAKQENFNPDFEGGDGYILPFILDDRMIFAPKATGVYSMDFENNKLIPDEFVSSYLGQDLSCWLIKQDLYGNCYIENSGPVYVLKKNGNEIALDTTSLADLNVGYINDIYCSQSGVTWLIGEEGIVKYDPTEIKTKQNEFTTIINGVYINTDSILYEGNYFAEMQNVKHCVLNNGYHNISFSFTSPQYAFEGKLMYAYKLEGYDLKFSDWTSDSKAVYTNLDAGNYRFLVKSINSNGVESEVEEFLFEVLPPWYRTWWAYLLYVVCFLGILIISVRIYSARLKRSNIRLQKSVEEKTKVISSNLAELALQKGQLEERNSEIIGSIEYAKRLQTAILPSSKSLEAELGDYFVYYNPKDIVAGDFYWMSKNKQHKNVLIAVADCTGHGVPGALVSVVCSDALKTAVNEFKLTKTDEILDAVNKMVLETFNADAYGEENEYLVRDGMDIALCSIDFVQRKLMFTGANNPVWIVTQREMNLEKFFTQNSYNVYELKGDRKPIGGYASVDKFSRTIVDVAENDIVYMFTDGIVDQFGSLDNSGKNKKFKRINLAKLLVNIQPLELSLHQEKIKEMFHQWKGTNEQIDDVTIMGIKID